MNPSGDFLSGASIVLVEDDGDIARLIVQTLSEFGFQTTWCKRAAEFRTRLKIELPDLAMIDLGLPDVDGMALVRELRESDDCGIIVITGRSHSGDRIMGLEFGADDYVVKPVDLHELAARLRALVRRAHGQPQECLTAHDVVLDPASRTVRKADVAVALSNREFALLQAFMLGAGRVLSREQLEQQLYSWGQEVDSNAIEVHIHNMRRKLGNTLIHTVRGVGYTLLRDAPVP